MDLLPSFGKEGVALGLLTKKVDIEDTEHLSKYFNVVEFNSVLTAGRNPVAFNGTSYLKDGSEIQVECIDSEGNSLYIERAKAKDSQYTDVANFVISIHVYDEIANGGGKLAIVGTTKLGEIVRWIANISIDKTLTNSSKVRIYNTPVLDVRPLLYPVVDTDLAKVEFPLPPPNRTATATATISSKVSYITVTNGGSGYVSTDVVVIDGGGGSGATATLVVEGGIIAAITVTNGGSGYISIPTATVFSATGTGAVAVINLLSIVTSITVTDGGFGYVDAPSVIISGIGSKAEAYSVVTDGAVTNVVITNPGFGYLTIPTVIIASPPEPPPPVLNIPVSFSSNFYGIAVAPKKDTNKQTLDKKRIDVDYRITLTDLSIEDAQPSMYPTNVFNTQMEGATITLNVGKIQVPFSNTEAQTDITSSFTIKKVIDYKTAILNTAFFYTVGKDQIVTNIIHGICNSDYTFIQYNTNPDSTLTVKNSSGEEVNVKESYAEITYRNLRTYSGRIARHKLYRKSLFYPGDFKLISDEPLGAIELLEDTVTFNKAYSKMGYFYHLAHISKYWFPSSTDITLNTKNDPINSVYIKSDNFLNLDGHKYIIAKNDSIGIINDSVYYPYDQEQVDRLSGESYNSNFITLKKDALYSLTFNLAVEKDKLDKNAKISFYFTSSTDGIQKEKTFDLEYGMKLGEVAVAEEVSTKYFSDKQQLYFSPTSDYYGTLVIVPYHCNIILSELSFKVYGDHGFSPDVLFIRIPFPINVKNETFEIRAELFDINSNLIYSGLRDIETFDPNGESLFILQSQSGVSDIFDAIDIIVNDNGETDIHFPSNSLTIDGDVFLDLDLNEEDPQRFVGWKYPVGENPGQLVYTNVAKLIVLNSDYIELTSVQSGVEYKEKALAIKYDGAASVGRRIYVIEDGSLSGIKVKLP
jgi:hypothetical protein